LRKDSLVVLVLFLGEEEDEEFEKLNCRRRRVLRGWIADTGGVLG
jgi:hypothetical protein